MVAHLFYIIVTHRTARVHVRCVVFPSVLLEVFVGIAEKLIQLFSIAFLLVFPV